MGQARTNARRRKQAANNFNHPSPRQRPNYKKRSAEVAAERDAELRRRENERRQRGAKF